MDTNVETPRVTLYEIERNGITLPFVNLNKRRKEGQTEGDAYPGIIVNPQTRSTVIAWLGDDLDGILSSKLNQLFQGLAAEATDERTGEFNVQQFTKLVLELSRRGEKMSVLVEQLKAAANQLGALADEQIAAEEAGDEARAEELGLEMRAMAKEARRIKDAINAKSRKTPEEAAEAKAALAQA